MTKAQTKHTRNGEIYTAWAKGETQASLARRFQITRERVRQIINRAKKQEPASSKILTFDYLQKVAQDKEDLKNFIRQFIIRRRERQYIKNKRTLASFLRKKQKKSLEEIGQMLNIKPLAVMKLCQKA